MNNSVQLFEGELSMVTKPIPKISHPKDVLIKVLFSGVCGTDLHILAGDFPASNNALTLGHEFCGIIQSIGEEVFTVKVGDKVVVNPYSQCNNCHYCASGQPNYCGNGGIGLAVGIGKNGGWANYCKVPEVLVHKIPVTMPLQKGVFIEPFSCILRGWSNLGIIKNDGKILVCGGGIIGMLWSSLLHFKGYRDIVVSEVSERQRVKLLELNLGFKVVHPDGLDNIYRESVKNSSSQWGFDVIIDCTGVPRAIEQSFNWLKHGATFLLFGCCPKKLSISLSPFDIYNKELKIVGSLANPYTFPAAIAVVQDMEKYLDFEKFNIKTYDLQNYSHALNALKSGEISKAVFDGNS